MRREGIMLVRRTFAFSFQSVAKIYQHSDIGHGLPTRSVAYCWDVLHTSPCIHALGFL